eukprot:CAMPEP_0116954420 /NCGR_PEP_ID=MMETSP0467-20121206/41937_1 /TAXON_ID=283647 /ORGANISM="Mesodinium pulex, Strain SPMC105" /LENGTH=43 /DNA_ID= /DNA_START= /DNA_END= /DNA_ORIENTATION=
MDLTYFFNYDTDPSSGLNLVKKKHKKAALGNTKEVLTDDILRK